MYGALMASGAYLAQQVRGPCANRVVCQRALPSPAKHSVCVLQVLMACDSLILLFSLTIKQSKCLTAVPGPLQLLKTGISPVPILQHAPVSATGVSRDYKT